MTGTVQQVEQEWRNEDDLLGDQFSLVVLCVCFPVIFRFVFFFSVIRGDWLNPIGVIQLKICSSGI